MNDDDGTPLLPVHTGNANPAGAHGGSYNALLFSSTRGQTNWLITGP